MRQMILIIIFLSGHFAAAAEGAKESTINQGSDQGGQSQSSGAGMNAALGAALIAAGLAPCPTPAGCNVPLLIMGAMAMMQSGADKGAADQSGAVYSSSYSDPTKYGNGTGTGTNGTGTAKGTGTSAYDGVPKDVLDKISAAGFSLSPNGTLTGPNGVVPSDAFNSAEGMAAAGMGSSESINSALNTAKGAMDKILSEQQGADSARVVAMGYNNPGGGGGGYGSGADSSGGGGSSGFDYGSLFKKSADEKARMVAGKSVSLGNEQIGVKMDNIFEMVHRRYQAKRTVNGYFLEK